MSTDQDELVRVKRELLELNTTTSNERDAKITKAREEAYKRLIALNTRPATMLLPGRALSMYVGESTEWKLDANTHDTVQLRAVLGHDHLFAGFHIEMNPCINGSWGKSIGSHRWYALDHKQNPNITIQVGTQYVCGSPDSLQHFDKKDWNSCDAAVPAEGKKRVKTKIVPRDQRFAHYKESCPGWNDQGCGPMCICCCDSRTLDWDQYASDQEDDDDDNPGNTSLLAFCRGHVPAIVTIPPQVYHLRKAVAQHDPLSGQLVFVPE
jgi:hypothetical protein